MKFIPLFMRRCAIVAVSVAVTCATSILPAAAQSPNEVVQARIIPGWRMSDGSHMAGLELQLHPGWKTYWRAPGDAGIPPTFDWRQSRNLAGAQIAWPVPKRMDQGGMTTIGYTGTVVLPLRLTPDRAGGDIRLRGVLDLGVCHDICVPISLKVDAALPNTAAKRDPRIAAALANRPDTAAEAGVGRVACSVRPAKDGGLHLRAEITLSHRGKGEMVVVETTNPGIWVAPTRTLRQGGRLIAETDLVHVEGRSFALDRSGLRLTVISAKGAVDIQGCPAG
ncbi:protein-disulfide reductase DsbD family protein [Rhodobacteraceae bacterium KMM 6894]|nr:protein-disulfide reductase DsbD family protein [Rhodobacteraceae bacterium KMM 6894]